jgi:hypothetical protein
VQRPREIDRKTAMCDDLEELNFGFLMAAFAHVNAECDLRQLPNGATDYDALKQKVQEAEAEYFRTRSLVINHRLQHGCAPMPTE